MSIQSIIMRKPAGEKPADRAESIRERLLGILYDVEAQERIGSEEAAQKFKRTFLLTTDGGELREVTVTVQVAHKQPKSIPATAREQVPDGQMSFGLADDDEDDE